MSLNSMSSYERVTPRDYINLSEFFVKIGSFRGRHIWPEVELRRTYVAATPQRRNINTDANKARFSCRKRKLGIKYE